MGILAVGKERTFKKIEIYGEIIMRMNLCAPRTSVPPVAVLFRKIVSDLRGMLKENFFRSRQCVVLAYLKEIRDTLSLLLTEMVK